MSIGLLSNKAGSGTLLPAKRLEEDAHFDITAMIDLVFMMNIFFMVTAMATALAEINLASAQHCMAADTEGAVIITIMANASEPLVYLGSADGTPLAHDEQDKAITAAVEQALASGHGNVIIRAEQEVLHKDVARIARMASESSEVKLHLAVLETN
jgi:biopolymer transport protein ExbD